MTDNELIATFMGAKKIHEGQWAERWLFEDRLPQMAYFEGALLYNESWDWLMPVVRKIDRTQLFDLVEYRELSEFGIFSDIENVYNAVIDFIKAYNERF